MLARGGPYAVFAHVAKLRFFALPIPTLLQARYFASPNAAESNIRCIGVSRSLKSVGPNSTPVADDFEKVIRMPKAELA
jgi:hypothetical protein